MLSKIMPPTYLFITLCIMLALHFVLPITRIVYFPWILTGCIPLILGIILNLIADKEFKRHETTVKPNETSSALIDHGVFRLSRNPMYLGMMLILSGVAILLGSLTPFFMVVVFVVFIDIVFIRLEEKMMEEAFTSDWLQYQRKVRRWI
jgi:protein-S-isoprenylcysteine O-methyltransferase Ste14